MAKGKFIEYVVSDNPNKYPNGREQGGYYYELISPLPFLSFIGNEDFTLETGGDWDGILEYSTDTTTWKTWDGTTISSVGNKLYLRGIGNTTMNYDIFTFTGTDALKIACKGNIENLLDYETVSAGGHPTMAEYCFYCMFADCTSLITVPELPATTLAQSCYQYMFAGCTSLTTAPELPATTLANYCYNSMFNGCTALTTAPELPATTLATSCYGSMFSGCTALTTAPELPATTLANSCYQSMFEGCTSLTTAPELPATRLVPFCYKSMFNGCTKIKLSATQTGEYQTAYRIPVSGTGTTASDALLSMFKSTGGTFTRTPEINTTYYTSNTVV